MKVTPPLLAVVCAWMLAATPDVTAAPRRGAFAFHYGSPLTREEVDWYGRFDVLVTHDPLPPAQVSELHRRGTRLVLYEWSIAFYGKLVKDGSWERSLLRSGSAVLLNERGLRGGVGAVDADAWYFDPAENEHTEARSEQIARRLEKIRYDGVFLDTTRFESVHPVARREYSRRHPTVSYDQAYARFLERLRKKLGSKIIFTNQGFRAAEFYLPYADWDLTESFVTYPRNGRFTERRWNDPNDPWNSISHILRELILPAALKYPKVRFGHLNYLSSRNRDAIALVVATALLHGAEGYAVGNGIEQERDLIYFIDLGKPVSDVTAAEEGAASYRVFEDGVVVVVTSASGVRLRDPLFVGGSFCDRASGTRYPGGKPIFLTGSRDGKPRGYLLSRVERGSSDCSGAGSGPSGR